MDLETDGCTPRCVLFDLDNTLIPFLPAMRTWARTWAHRMVPPSKRTALADELVEFTLQGGEDPRRGIDQAISRWNLHVDDALAEAAAQAADRAYRSKLAPYPEIEDALEELSDQGKQLAIVTDAPDARATERLAATGLSKHFDLVVSRDHTRHGKEGPEPFLKALNALAVAATDTAMIGDWPRYDVRWPKRLGMTTVLAGWGCSPSNQPRVARDRPWAVAPCPSELPMLLDGVTPSVRAELMRPANVRPLTAF